MCTRKCPIGFRDCKGDFMKGGAHKSVAHKTQQRFYQEFQANTVRKTIKFNSILSSLQKFQISAKHKKLINQYM